MGLGLGAGTMVMVTGAPTTPVIAPRCTACSSSGISVSSRELLLKRSSSGSMRLKDLLSARSVREPGMFARPVL